MKWFGLGSLLLVAGIGFLSCKIKSVDRDHPVPAPTGSAPSEKTAFDAGSALCLEGRYIVPPLSEWVSESLPTEDCLARRLSPVADKGRAILSVCVPDVASGIGAAPTSPETPGASRDQVVPLGREGECRLTGHLTTKGGRVSGEVDFAFVLRNNGTDRLSLRVEDLSPDRVYDLVFALVGASLAPFTQKDKEGFAWQYYSAECRRNRLAVISSSPLSKPVAVRESLIRLGVDEVQLH